jgi:hypothetical protein
MFNAGVSVGAMTANDWPIISMRFNAPERSLVAGAVFVQATDMAFIQWFLGLKSHW